MGENTKPPPVRPAEDVIKAFDREREQANELKRRHDEQVRTNRANDRPARELRKRPS